MEETKSKGESEFMCLIINYSEDTLRAISADRSRVLKMLLFKGLLQTANFLHT